MKELHTHIQNHLFIQIVFSEQLISLVPFTHSLINHCLSSFWFCIHLYHDKQKESCYWALFYSKQTNKNLSKFKTYVKTGVQIYQIKYRVNLIQQRSCCLHSKQSESEISFYYNIYNKNIFPTLCEIHFVSILVCSGKCHWFYFCLCYLITIYYNMDGHYFKWALFKGLFIKLINVPEVKLWNNLTLGKLCLIYFFKITSK